ncbi:hypothetical protein ADUPG1_003612, partial [Aduncisulcus paluster]
MVLGTLRSLKMEEKYSVEVLEKHTDDFLQAAQSLKDSDDTDTKEILMDAYVKSLRPFPLKEDVKARMEGKKLELDDVISFAFDELERIVRIIGEASRYQKTLKRRHRGSWEDQKSATTYKKSAPARKGALEPCKYCKRRGHLSENCWSRPDASPEEKEKLERLKEAIKRKKTPRTSAKVMLMKEEETPQPIIPISINKRT